MIQYNSQPKQPQNIHKENASSYSSNLEEISDIVNKNPTPGDRDQNPTGISLFRLVIEDFHTYDSHIFDPCFWAIVIHRYGNWRMNIRPRLIRMPFSFLHTILYKFMNLFFGIHLNYTVKLGRRVRLWHHGGVFLGAISIGDDVSIHQNTTIGVLNGDEMWKRPIIEDRVRIGPGACILGDVIVGHDSVIGPNSVVVRSFPPISTLFGVPARRVNMKPNNE